MSLKMVPILQHTICNNNPTEGNSSVRNNITMFSCEIKFEQE
jgi:hypothetical protein